MKKESFGHVNMEQFSSTYGVGAIVFNSRGEILVGTEKINKAESGRAEGQTSIPMETLKPFERRNSSGMILASTSEFVTEENIYKLQKGLRTVALDGPVKLDAEGLEGAIAVHSWIGDPDEVPFIPSNPDETTQYRWINPIEFQNQENSRPFAIMLVDFALTRGYLYTSCPTVLRSPIISLKPDRYFAAREMHADVTR